MKFNGQDYKLYEIYNLFSKEDNEKGYAHDKAVVEEFIKQRVNFSRIAFKDFRDELVKNHEFLMLDPEHLAFRKSWKKRTQQ